MKNGKYGKMKPSKYKRVHTPILIQQLKELQDDISFIIENKDYLNEDEVFEKLNVREVAALKRELNSFTKLISQYIIKHFKK